MFVVYGLLKVGCWIFVLWGILIAFWGCLCLLLEGFGSFYLMHFAYDCFCLWICLVFVLCLFVLLLCFDVLVFVCWFIVFWLFGLPRVYLGVGYLSTLWLIVIVLIALLVVIGFAWCFWFSGYFIFGFGIGCVAGVLSLLAWLFMCYSFRFVIGVVLFVCLLSWVVGALGLWCLFGYCFLYCCFSGLLLVCWVCWLYEISYIC